MPKFLNGITSNELASSGSEAISVRVTGDSVARFRIDAGGRITWSDGTETGDIYLERSAVGEISSSGDFGVQGVITVGGVEIDPVGANSGQVFIHNGTKFV